MTNNKKLFRARGTSAQYVVDGESSSGYSTASDFGYIWMDVYEDDDTDVAAVTVKEKTQRVWLDKRNHDSAESCPVDGERGAADIPPEDTAGAKPTLKRWTGHPDPNPHDPIFSVAIPRSLVKSIYSP